MTSHPFGTGWRFGPASAGSDRPEFDDSGFAEARDTPDLAMTSITMAKPAG
ncbi:MAG TPA: hypothetical protein VE888_22535 [Streptosporangiaceae bacterium]|nr:hypothetical protein [Streptosporangiaceae bacterium]